MKSLSSGISLYRSCSRFPAKLEACNLIPVKRYSLLVHIDAVNSTYQVAGGEAGAERDGTTACVCRDDAYGMQLISVTALVVDESVLSVTVDETDCGHGDSP